MGKKQQQNPHECEHCFMSGEPPFPTCRYIFNPSIDADNTCILWRNWERCPDFTPKKETDTTEKPYYLQGMSEPLMIVKIEISILKYHGITEAVVYYNYKLPMHLALKYDWYFEYLTALLKVRHPHRRVILTIRRSDECLAGQKYIDNKRPTLINGKKRNITRIRNQPFTDDLFNLARAERDAKIASVQAEIDALERGEFNYYVPPTYINKIKDWLK